MTKKRYFISSTKHNKKLSNVHRNKKKLFGICVFENSSYCRIQYQDFWLMQMDLCLDLELSMENYLRIFLAEV